MNTNAIIDTIKVTFYSLTILSRRWKLNTFFFSN